MRLSTFPPGTIGSGPAGTTTVWHPFPLPSNSEPKSKPKSLLTPLPSHAVLLPIPNKDKQRDPPPVALPDRESIESRLLDVFQGRTSALSPSQLPCTDDVSATVLETAPYTKARLVYPSALVACSVVSYLRTHKIGPAAIFGGSDGSNDGYGLAYGSKA